MLCYGSQGMPHCREICLGWTCCTGALPVGSYQRFPVCMAKLRFLQLVEIVKLRTPR